MYLVSSDPRPSSVFTTQAKESATEPMAIRLMIGFDIRRPNKPFSRKPSSGNTGINQRYMSVLHRTNIVNHQRSTILKNCQNNRQPHRRLGRSHHHHEEAEDMSVHLFQRVGESDERQIHRVEHQLDGHENRNNVAAINETRHSKSKQYRAEYQVPTRWHASRHCSNLLSRKYDRTQNSDQNQN